MAEIRRRPGSTRGARPAASYPSRTCAPAHPFPQPAPVSTAHTAAQAEHRISTPPKFPQPSPCVLICRDALGSTYSLSPPTSALRRGSSPCRSRLRTRTRYRGCMNSGGVGARGRGVLRVIPDRNPSPVYIHCTVPAGHPLSWGVYVLTRRDPLKYTKACRTRTMDRARSHPRRSNHAAPTKNRPCGRLESKR